MLSVCVPFSEFLRTLFWLSRENIYGNEKAGGGSQPPLMIVLYRRWDLLDPLWNVRHLGKAPPEPQVLKRDATFRHLYRWSSPELVDLSGTL